MYPKLLRVEIYQLNVLRNLFDNRKEKIKQKNRGANNPKQERQVFAIKPLKNNQPLPKETLLARRYPNDR
jgi:hypothetical protein